MAGMYHLLPQLYAGNISSHLDEFAKEMKTELKDRGMGNAADVLNSVCRINNSKSRILIRAA